MLKLNLERENLGKPFHLALLMIFFFLVIYFPPGLFKSEFRWRSEALFSVIAMEMDISRPNTIAHGEIISDMYPLFPIIISIMGKLGVPYEFAGRLISVFFVAAAAVLIFYATLRAYDLRAAFVATSFAFSTLLIMEKGIEGLPETFSFFFLLCAWLLWFNLGVHSGRWNIAWLLSFFFCGLSFYTTGWSALFYFFLPLIFMRRPLGVWSRLSKPGFYLGIMILAFFVIIWSYPRWIAGHDIPFRNIASEIRIGYLRQILIFPLNFFLRTFPWLFLLWPVFCSAYDNLERNPIFARFLRTIFFTLFFFNWFVPGAEPREYCLLLLPLAILTGSHYEVFMRRNSLRLGKFLLQLNRFAFVLALAALIFYLSPTVWFNFSPYFKTKLSFLIEWKLQGIFLSVIAVLIYIFIVRVYHMNRLPIFMHILSISAMLMTLFWSFIAPYRVHSSGLKPIALHIKKAIGDDFSKEMLIYQSRDIPKDYYGVMVYLGCRAKRLQKGPEEIPLKLKKVYYLALETPLAPERKWQKKISFSSKRGEVSLWLGELQEKKEATEEHRSITKEETIQ